MAGFTIYAQQKINDHARGKTAWTMPTNFLALFRCTAGTVVSPRSLAVTVGQTTLPATANGRMYRVTTAGTTGASEPTWGTTAGGTTTDGTATWTEMTPDFEANNANVTGIEANYTGYGRLSTAGTDWTAASGINGLNATALNFGSATGGTNLIGAMMTYDAPTGGNGLWYLAPSAPNTAIPVSNGITPGFAIGALNLTLD